jgi:hypothetical protein
MATIEQIAELRNAVQEPANEPPYTDDMLSEMIDTYGMDIAEGKIWEAKAASVSKLVDISEGGSSRKMSQIFTNWSALASRAYQRGEEPAPDATSTRPRSRKATRA